MTPVNAPPDQPEALAGLSQLVHVRIKPTVLADGSFRQRYEDRRTVGGTNLCGADEPEQHLVQQPDRH